MTRFGDQPKRVSILAAQRTNESSASAGPFLNTTEGAAQVPSDQRGTLQKGA